MDMKSAVASKGHLAREEQWCDREHVAALVLPKSSKEDIMLIIFSELTNCISCLLPPSKSRGTPMPAPVSYFIKGLLLEVLLLMSEGREPAHVL